MHQGLKKILERLKQTPGEALLVDRFLALIKDEPDRAEKKLMLLDLARVVAKLQPKRSLRIAYEVYGQVRDHEDWETERFSIDCLQVMILALRSLGREQSVHTLKNEIRSVGQKIAARRGREEALNSDYSNPPDQGNGQVTISLEDTEAIAPSTRSRSFELKHESEVKPKDILDHGFTLDLGLSEISEPMAKIALDLTPPPSPHPSPLSPPPSEPSSFADSFDEKNSETQSLIDLPEQEEKIPEIQEFPETPEVPEIAETEATPEAPAVPSAEAVYQNTQIRPIADAPSPQLIDDLKGEIKELRSLIVGMVGQKIKGKESPRLAGGDYWERLSGFLYYGHGLEAVSFARLQDYLIEVFEAAGMKYTESFMTSLSQDLEGEEGYRVLDRLAWIPRLWREQKNDAVFELFRLARLSHMTRQGFVDYIKEEMDLGFHLRAYHRLRQFLNSEPDDHLLPILEECLTQLGLKKMNFDPADGSEVLLRKLNVRALPASLPSY